MYIHQTWEFCKAWYAIYDCVAKPIIYTLVPSPSRFENKQYQANRTRKRPEKEVRAQSRSSSSSTRMILYDGLRGSFVA